MRFLIRSLMVSLMVLASGCVIVPANRGGLGFYGPFPAVYVRQYQAYDGRYDDDRRGNYGGDYDDRRYDHRRHDNDGHRY